MPTLRTSLRAWPRLCTWRRASMAVSRWVVHSSRGSCSTQPGLGKICRISRCACARIWPRSSKTMLRELEVPWSRARIRAMSGGDGQGHAGFLQQGGEGRGGQGFGEGAGDVLQACGLGQRRMMELAHVGDQPGLARLVHHGLRSEEHTSELQSRENLVCRLLLE